jgi:hypothetical protein
MTLLKTLVKYPASPTSKTVSVPYIDKSKLKSRTGSKPTRQGGTSNVHFLADGDISSDLTVFHGLRTVGANRLELSLGHTVNLEVVDDVAGTTIVEPQEITVTLRVSRHMTPALMMKMILAQFGLTHTVVTSGDPDADLIGQVAQGIDSAYD